jgi:hypothetical protein
MSKINSIIILLVLFLNACAKREIGHNSQYLSILLMNDTTPCNDRLMFQPGEMNTFSSINDAPFSATQPCFNPNNPYQIAYVRETFNANKREASIITLDLSTGNSQTIYTGTPTFLNLNWSHSGEILFTKDRQVYLIKADGTGLRQITNNQYYNGLALWYKQDSLILLRRDGGRLCFYDRDGQLQDTIAGNWYTYSLDCNQSKEILLPSTSFDSNQLAIIHTDQTISYYSFTLPSSPFLYTKTAKFNPINSNEIFFYRGAEANGLFKYDKASGSINSIMPFCPSENIVNFNISPDGKKIIAEAYIRRKLSTWNEGGHYVLLLMNTDGTDRQIIKVQ